MGSRRFTQRLAALLVLPAFLLAGTGPREFALYRCRFNGQTRRTCCCPPDRDVATTMVITKACCCEISTIRIALSANNDPRHDHAAGQPAPIAIVAVTGALTPPPPPSRAPDSAFQHPIHGPPLLVLKQSFLL